MSRPALDADGREIFPGDYVTYTFAKPSGEAPGRRAYLVDGLERKLGLVRVETLGLMGGRMLRVVPQVPYASVPRRVAEAKETLVHTQATLGGNRLGDVGRAILASASNGYRCVVVECEDAESVARTLELRGYRVDAGDGEVTIGW